MSKCRFKVGDLITGNDRNTYGITNKRRIVKVVLVGKGEYKGVRLRDDLNDNMLVELTDRDLHDYSEHVYSVCSRAFQYSERYKKLLEIAKVIK